jgi:hypothetical protein
VERADVVLKGGVKHVAVGKRVQVVFRPLKGLLGYVTAHNAVRGTFVMDLDMRGKITFKAADLIYL